MRAWPCFERCSHGDYRTLEGLSSTSPSGAMLPGLQWLPKDRPPMANSYCGTAAHKAEAGGRRQIETGPPSRPAQPSSAEGGVSWAFLSGVSHMCPWLAGWRTEGHPHVLWAGGQPRPPWRQVLGLGQRRLDPAGNKPKTSHGNQDAWKTPLNIINGKSCGFQRIRTEDVKNTVIIKSDGETRQSRGNAGRLMTEFGVWGQEGEARQRRNSGLCLARA